MASSALSDHLGVERSQAIRLRLALWDWLDAEAARVPLLADDVGVRTAWSEAVRRAGVPTGDVDAHRHRLRGVLAVLRRLPTDSIALAHLAADEFDGDVLEAMIS